MNISNQQIIQSLNFYWVILETRNIGELAYRRGSVRDIVSNKSSDDHPSLRSTWELSPFLATGMSDPCSTLDLAPNGGYQAT